MKITTLAVAGSALALALTGCVAGESGTSAQPGGQGGQGGSVKIGIKFDQPGLGQKVGDTYKGFDVDVAKYVAKELGYDPAKIQWVETPSATRETAIQGGQVDMIFATYSITDERKKKVDFGGPYYIAGQDLLVRADNTDITGPQSLNGKKVCSVAGSTSAKKIKDQYSQGAQLQDYDTYSKCAEALASGTVDVLTTDDTILAGYAAQDQYKGKFKVVGNPFTEEKYGVGIKKGDTQMCTKVNAAIKKMIDDGSWQKALDANLGPAGFKPNAKLNPPNPSGNCGAA